MSEKPRIFRQVLAGPDGPVHGPEEVIDAGPFTRPGLGSFVELEDGWYRLRRYDPEKDGEGWPEPAPLPPDYWETAE